MEKIEINKMLNRMTNESMIGVKAPYNEIFINKAKKMGAVWYASGKMWIFKEEQKEQVENLLVNIYGWIKPNTTPVQVKIVFDKMPEELKRSNKVMLGDITLIERKYRDRQPLIINCLYPAEFEKSAGSAKYPEIAPLAGETSTIQLPEEIWENFKNIEWLEKK